MKNRHFSSLPEPTPDPIFAMAKQAQGCGADVIDATIGVCMDEKAAPLVLASTRQAENARVNEMTANDFSYPPILGLESFRQSVRALLFGNEARVEFSSFSTAGGQGALHTNLQLLKRVMPDASIILPTPAWGNHFDLLHGANIPVQEINYLENGIPTTEPIIRTLKETSKQMSVLLQAGGHNPTGLDFTQEQWRELADVFREKNTIAFLDVAYQGLIDDPVEDASVSTLFAEREIETLIAWSASKNHSIYAYRTGLAGAIVHDRKTQQVVEGHYSGISSELQSAAPTPGQVIVSIVQQRLKAEWLRELADIRALVAQKRHDLIELLNMDQCIQPLQGKGLFARLPLNPIQLRRLREEKRVFLLGDGRINISGVPLARIDELAEKIRSVVQS